MKGFEDANAAKAEIKQAYETWKAKQ
nr:hypothetical protein [Pantoea stewartii]